MATTRLDALTAVPARVRADLQTLVRNLTDTCNAQLASIVLYGGMARGRFHQGRSGADLLIVLTTLDAATLAALATTIHDAPGTLIVQPFITTPDELPQLARAFATRIDDMKRTHITLHGDDPLDAITVDPADIRHRATQELANIALRLRNRLPSITADVVAQASLLQRIARPLALQVHALLELDGIDLPADERTAVIYERAAQTWSLDTAALAALAALREGDAQDHDITEIYQRVVQATQQLLSIATAGPGHNTSA
jgi:hypothetical protein